MQNKIESHRVIDSIKAARKSPAQIAKSAPTGTKYVQVDVENRSDNGLGRIRRPSEDRNNKSHGKYTEPDARRRKRNRVVVIGDEFVELTTEPIAAALPGQFNFYQTLAANKEGDFLMEEQMRESMHGDAGAIIPPTCCYDSDPTHVHEIRTK